ncbi:MAG: DNA alkylation repair protein [Nitrososphaeria archaeon]
MSEDLNRLYVEIFKRFKALSNEETLKGMERYAIKTSNAYGVPNPELRKMAKEVGRNHLLAERLWTSGMHEARILATMIEDPQEVTEEQMEKWVKEIDSWDICDSCCGNLFDRTVFAYSKAEQWSSREEELVKRAGFVLMANLVIHDKKAKDEVFVKFLKIIEREASDERNFVKKAINWALRQIGKRNVNLNLKAIEACEEIRKSNSKSARWIAAEALRELKSERIQRKVTEKRGYIHRL